MKSASTERGYKCLKLDDPIVTGKLFQVYYVLYINLYSVFLTVYADTLMIKEVSPSTCNVCSSRQESITVVGQWLKRSNSAYSAVQFTRSILNNGAVWVSF